MSDAPRNAPTDSTDDQPAAVKYNRGLIEHAPDGIAVTDENGRFKFVSPSAYRIFGYTPEDMQTQTGNDLTHPDDLPRVIQALQAILIDPARIEKVEYRFRQKDGTYRWIESTFSNRFAVPDVNGLVINFHDITAAKQAQLALAASEEKYRRLAEELEQRVQERTAQVQDLYDSAPTGYHSLDANGVYQMINQTELNWLGYTREELVGKHKLIDHLNPESAQLFVVLYPLFMERGWLKNIEYTYIRKDGSLLPVLLNATAIYDEQGRYVMSRTTIFDNTERKKAEEELKASRDQLSAANIALARAAKMKDEFLASMSDELRTPLTGILGLAEALQLETYGMLNERQEKALKNLENSGRHLLELINDVLDLSKIEADKLDLQFELCDVAAICQASLQLTSGMAQMKNQKVRFTSNSMAATVRADPRRLKQMLVNLLSNAVKFTPEGGSLGLELTGSEQNQLVYLTVWDKGIGIKAEDINRLFTPFTQLDSSLSRQQAGAGLGLSLVAKLASLHGGSVTVESIFGEGSRFTLTLPWQFDTEAPLAVEAHPQPVQPGNLKGTILFVDDDQVILETITDFLEAKGYRILKAQSGLELLEKAPQVRADVILTDIQMPGMDGLQAIRSLRASGDPYLARVPIVAITALAMPGDEELCLNAGANRYISKPIMLGQLVELIEELMGVKEPDA